MNLYQHRDRYDWREAGGLMRRTVVNESLRILRQPHMSVLPDEASDPSSQSKSPSRQMIESETVIQVRRAIDRLPENFRAALVLCEYEKMSYAQIAETLEASIPQVKTWIHRGRRQLAELLRAYAEQT
jgi:RNA polymerase sigma-70 factor (ECF subfamily)